MRVCTNNRELKDFFVFASKNKHTPLVYIIQLHFYKYSMRSYVQFKFFADAFVSLTLKNGYRNVTDWM